MLFLSNNSYENGVPVYLQHCIKGFYCQREMMCNAKSRSFLPVYDYGVSYVVHVMIFLVRLVTVNQKVL